MSNTQNTPLSPPPIQTSIQNSKSTGIVDHWASWINDVYRQLSPNVTTITLANAGPIDLDAPYIGLIGAAGSSYSVTLAAPTIPNRDKIIEMTSYSSHSVTLALTNVTGGAGATTCTWTGTNQQLILKSAASKWVIIKSNGVTLS